MASMTALLPLYELSDASASILKHYEQQNNLAFPL